MTQRHVLLALGSYQAATHRGVARLASERGWHLTADMAYGGVVPHGWEGDGILTALTDDAELFRFVKAAAGRGVPVVDLNLQRTELALPRVVGDHHQIGRMAAEHLLAKGHRRFAWYCQHVSPSAALRWEGFTSVLVPAGMEVFDLLPAPSPSDWRTCRDVLARRLRRASSSPLAVFAYNDYQAATVIHAAQHAGLAIPDQLAVLGVDNDEFVCDSLSTPLSSIRHDLEGRGYLGARLLDELMGGAKPPAAPILVPPQGVISRRSTDAFAFADNRMAAAMTLMHRQLARDLSVGQIAAEVGVSRRTLEKTFSAVIGRGVHAELLRLRVLKAVELLQQTSLPTQRVAERTGLRTASYLAQVIRRETGRTPMEIRGGGGAEKA